MTNRQSKAKPIVLQPPFYVVSDTHFFHDNIVKYCGRPRNHINLMIERWQETVGPDDIVLHLGDVFFSRRNGYQKMEGIAAKLPGEKYLILGNHDEPKIDWKKLGFTPIQPFDISYRGFLVSFDHYPAGNADRVYAGQKRIRVHGHIHNNGYGSVNRPYVRYRSAHINVSIEEMDYRPVSVTKLLDAEVARQVSKQRYVNDRRKTEF